MNIIFVSEDLFCLKIIGLKDLYSILYKIIESVQFDLSIKYDNWWNYHGNEPSPYSEFSEDDLDLFLRNNGQIEKNEPLIWKFNNIEAIKTIIYGFINAERSLILKTRDSKFEFSDVINSYNDDEIIKFWVNHSKYFLSTLMDYSGLIFVSKYKSIIDEIEKKLIFHIDKKHLKKYKGKNSIA